VTANTRRRLLILAVWFVATVTYAAAIIQHVLAGPPLGDVYAYNPSFQLFAFLVYRLPPLLILLAGVLLIDFLGDWSRAGQQPSKLDSIPHIGWAAIAAVALARVTFGMAQPTLNPYDQSFEYQALHFLRTAFPLLTGVLSLVILANGAIRRRGSDDQKPLAG